MHALPLPKMMIVEHMAEAMWRSYGAGKLNWEDVHPYVQQQHRKDANVALETAFPLICETILMLCEELTEDSTVLTKVIDILTKDFDHITKQNTVQTLLVLGRRSGKNQVVEETIEYMVSKVEHVHVVDGLDVTCPTNQCQPQKDHG